MTPPPFKARRINNGWTGIDIGLSGNWLLAVITACCASGFLLVGYDNGVMGGLVGTPEFSESFNDPDAATIGNIVSLYEIGCFFGALSTFVIGDFFGRRGTIQLGCLFMIAGAIIQAASNSVGVMILGRIVSGLGMGAINSTVPVLQAETSPAISRGQLVALDLTVLNFGIAISYWVDYAMNYGGVTGSKSWRIPIALQCVFIAGLFVTAAIIPDTPRWLAARGRDAEAVAVLERLQKRSSESAEIQEAFGSIQQAIEHERATAKSWSSLLFSRHDDQIRSRRRLLLACFIQFAQQAGGINALIYYSATLFTKSVGLEEKPAALLSGFLNMTLIVGSVISIFLVDRVGRKLLLLPCIAGMSLVMAFQSWFIYEVQQPNSNGAYGRAATAMLFLFELFFSVGFQATVWLIPSEVLPLTIRTKGSALSTGSNWIMNFAVVKFTPSAIENIKWRTYIIFAVLNAAWLPIIAIFLPETKGKSLEEIDELFAKDGWHLDAGHAVMPATSSSTGYENDLEAKSDGMVLDTSSAKAGSL